MARHTGTLTEVSNERAGCVAVFYASAAESLRSWLGTSKFHRHADCRALLGRNPNKCVIKDWMRDVHESNRCKVCWK